MITGTKPVTVLVSFFRFHFISHFYFNLIVFLGQLAYLPISFRYARKNLKCGDVFTTLKIKGNGNETRKPLRFSLDRAQTT